MNINSAFILAGGKGSRLKEITKSIPKPMIEIVDKPLLIHLINFYKTHGVRELSPVKTNETLQELSIKKEKIKCIQT